ncbi:MAG: hypothetical protein QNJ70_12845 [Xenococcaceae cyanobacterium MO_207.B15]|nr:hypothetical protein [Xenococcaceae cyanobacterium MO_207.B15]
MAYKIRTRCNKNQSSIPRIQATMSRHSVTSNQLTENRKPNITQKNNTVNFNLQTLPISSVIQRKNKLPTISNNSNILVQVKPKKKPKLTRNKFRRLYYKYRNGKPGKSIASVRMTLVKLAIRYYKIKTHNAEIKYINNTEIDKNAAANYTLKDDNSIEKTIIKFYPQLFKLPLNSFINTIRHEAYHVFLYNKGIYDVDRERRCHKHIHEFLAEAKEILSKNKENPQQFYQDASRALRHWILIYKNPPLPDFRDIDENQLMEFIKKQYDRVQRQVKKRYADFVDEYGADNQLAKKIRHLVNKYEQHRP